MKIVNKIYIFFFFIFFIKCGVIKDEKIDGTYIFKTKIGVEYLKLNRDKTFYFDCQIPLVSSKSEGYWKIEDGLLIINSDLKYKNDYVVVKELINEDIPFVQIIDEVNMGIFNVPIRINDNIFFTDIDGKFYLENIKLKKGDLLKFYPLGLSESKNIYEVTSLVENKSIIVKVFSKNIGKRYFEKDTLIIKGNKIIMNNQVYKKKR